MLIPNNRGQIPNKIKELFNQDDRFLLESRISFLKNNKNLVKNHNPIDDGYTCGFLRIGRKQNTNILLNIFTIISILIGF